jgi:hypothetical protein
VKVGSEIIFEDVVPFEEFAAGDFKLSPDATDEGERAQERVHIRHQCWPFAARK